MLLAMKYGCHVDTLIHCLRRDLFYLKGPIYTFISFAYNHLVMQEILSNPRKDICIELSTTQHQTTVERVG